jgi:hypothetical protein
MFRASLEPKLFMSIVETFSFGLAGDSNSNTAVVRECLDAFRNVPRFNTLLLFLSAKEKGLVREVWARLGVDDDWLAADPVWSVIA